MLVQSASVKHIVLVQSQLINRALINFFIFVVSPTKLYTEEQIDDELRTIRRKQMAAITDAPA